ncbi:D-alanyl-D-alanine endopeptidase, partial [Salmonella enterica subsp. enterica serovar Infantis]
MLKFRASFLSLALMLAVPF